MRFGPWGAGEVKDDSAPSCCSGGDLRAVDGPGPALGPNHGGPSLLALRGLHDLRRRTDLSHRLPDGLRSTAGHRLPHRVRHGLRGPSGDALPAGLGNGGPREPLHGGQAGLRDLLPRRALHGDAAGGRDDGPRRKLYPGPLRARDLRTSGALHGHASGDRSAAVPAEPYGAAAGPADGFPHRVLHGQRAGDHLPHGIRRSGLHGEPRGLRAGASADAADLGARRLRGRPGDRGQRGAPRGSTGCRRRGFARRWPACGIRTLSPGRWP